MYNYRFNIDCVGAYWEHRGISELYLSHHQKFTMQDLERMYEDAVKTCIENKRVYPFTVGEELISKYGFKEIVLECEMEQKLEGDANNNW